MATIALYADKINQMPGLIKDLKKSVTDYNKELFSLKSKALTINKSICDLDYVISSVQSSTQTQEDKIASLETFYQNSEQFISDTIQIDSDIAELIKQRKDEFYEKYNYLKPEYEKSGWEKFCDGLASAGEWCKEHWKLIVTSVLAVTALACLLIPGLNALVAGLFIGKIILGACTGILIGVLSGGLMGGLSSLAAGGSFWEGAENGAFTGALMGALFGGLGGLGQVLGSSCKVLGFLGNAAKVIPTISKLSCIISLGMAGFDLLSFGSGLIWGNDNWLTSINAKLHSSELYNAFQFTVSAVAVFTGGFTKGMQNPACFVAGTMILTAAGVVAIENIKAGDKVISTNAETFKTAEKTVVETYIREVPQLVHLTINGELISTTVDHPFYVKYIGFVNAGKLRVGNGVVNSNGNILFVENIKIELTENPVTVYNFQVEDWHTYHVGENGVLVHNADDYNAGVEAQRIGEARESKVAKITDGKVSREQVKTPFGSTDIDVVAKNGDIVMVGGPAKANDLAALGKTLKIYQHVASERGVNALAYFAEGTPDSVIQLAIKWLGAENVKIF